MFLVVHCNTFFPSTVNYFVSRVSAFSLACNLMVNDEDSALNLCIDTQLKSIINKLFIFIDSRLLVYRTIHLFCASLV